MGVVAKEEDCTVILMDVRRCGGQGGGGGFSWWV